LSSRTNDPLFIIFVKK